MKTKSKLGLAALAVVIGLGAGATVVGPTLAQAVGGGPQIAKHERGHRGGMHGSFGRIDGRLAFLKAELKITPAQEAQWTAFEKVLRDNATEMKGKFEKIRAERQKVRDEAKAQGKDRPEIKRMGAVERMEMRQTHAKERMDSQAKVLTAFKPLYASLSDDQKKTADSLFARHGHGGKGRHLSR